MQEPLRPHKFAHMWRAMLMDTGDMQTALQVCGWCPAEATDFVPHLGRLLTRIWAAQVPRIVRPLAGKATVSRASMSPCIHKSKAHELNPMCMMLQARGFACQQVVLTGTARPFMICSQGLLSVLACLIADRAGCALQHVLPWHIHRHLAAFVAVPSPALRAHICRCPADDLLTSQECL